MGDSNTLKYGVVEKGIAFTDTHSKFLAVFLNYIVIMKIIPK